MLQGDLGIIIELKYLKSAEEAFQQIIDRQYSNEFSDEKDCKFILSIGLNVDEEKQVTFKYSFEKKIIALKRIVDKNNELLI